MIVNKVVFECWMQLYMTSYILSWKFEYVSLQVLLTLWTPISLTMPKQKREKPPTAYNVPYPSAFTANDPPLSGDPLIPIKPCEKTHLKL